MRDDDAFWAAVDEGRLIAQRCLDCGTLRYPLLPMCGHCQSLAWEEHPLSGRGQVYAWLVSQHPTKADDSPRTVLLVDLAEGLRIVSNLAGGGPAEIGMPVHVSFTQVEGRTFHQFHPDTKDS